MIRSLFLSVLFFSVLLSSEYPQRFSQLGTPLYKSLKQIKQYKDIQPLQEYIPIYEQKANKTISHGFEVDRSKNSSEIKKYLFELRELQKSYDYFLHLLHESINKAVDKNDYELFLRLTSYEFDGLLKNINLKNKALSFYKKNKHKKISKILDKKIRFEQLVQKSSQEDYAQSTKSFFDSKGGKKQDKRSVFISTKQDRENIYVSITNKNLYDITIGIKPIYENTKESNNTKRVVVVKANSTKFYTKLSIGDKGIYYRYGYNWIIGSKDAIHNDSYIYHLPYKKGTSHIVSQGFNGRYTHKGSSKYAIDFVMNKGTRIYAARGGVVVKIKYDSNRGGKSKTYMRDANHIIIMHNDGTFAIYNHLMRYGVSVNVGDKVKKGYPIGYSGNTGYSSGPHLHFAVFKATSPYKIDTLYIRFASTKGVVTEPLVGVSYTAK